MFEGLLNLFTRSAAPAPAEMDLTSRTWSLRADTINEAERSVEAVLSTENPVEVWDWRSGRVIREVLMAEGAEFGRQVVLLDNHNRWDNSDVLGSVRGIRVENGQLVGRLFFVEGDDEVERVWRKVRQGHISDVSVGYRALETVDVAPNTQQTVKGRTFDGGATGLRVTTRWPLREVSVTPIGADHMAKMREAAEPQRPGNPRPESQKETTTMNQWLRKLLMRWGLRKDATDAQAQAFLASLDPGKRAALAGRLQLAPEATDQALGERLDALTDQQRTALETELAGEQTRTETPAPSAQQPAQQRAETQPAPAQDAGEIARAAIETERRRVASIRSLGGEDVPAEIVERAINDGWTVERAQGEFLAAIRNGRSQGTPGHGGIHVAPQARDQNPQMLSFGLAHRCGINLEQAIRVMHPEATEATRNQHLQMVETSYRFRGLSMLDLCRQAIVLDGRSVPFDAEETIRAAVSGAALAQIFTTSVNAQLLMSYAEAPDTTAGLTRDVDVSNFKQQDRIALGQSDNLEKLPRGQTARHATISDNIESYKIARYAKQFVVDEQDILDDDLNALMDMPMKMGQAARRLRPDLFYSILLANANMRDGVALINSASHGNELDQALDATQLKAAVTLMRLQTEDGKNLNLTPVFLLTATTLDFTGRELLNSTAVIIAGTAGAVTERGNANTIQSVGLQLRSDSRFDNGVTDPSSGTAYAGAATKWFLLASPSSGRTIEVGYLAGTGRRPQLRSFVLDRGQYGIGWDIKMDIGAKALDWRGIVRGNE